jgi:hypothetical protein
MNEAILKLIQAVDRLNQQIGYQRIGGADAANAVGVLLIEAVAALGIGGDDE